MKTHGIYLSVIAVMGIVIYILFRMYDVAHQQSIAKDSIITEKDSQIAYHVNAFGTLYAEKKAAVADLKALNEAYPDMIKEAVAKLDVKPKQLAVLTRTVIQAGGQGQIKIVHDTVSKVDVSMGDIDDGYLKMHGQLVMDVFDYVKYNYTYRDTLYQAFEIKNKWFGPDVVTIKSSLSNPNTKIAAETGLLVREIKKKRFNLSVGVTYNPFTGQFCPGVSAGFALLQF